jgi:hypothetical protein
MQKTTLFLILIALGLGGYVYFYEIRSSSQQETATASQQSLFSFAEEDVQRLEIESGETLEFVRLENNVNSWRMKQPEDSPAEAGTIVFLLDLLVEEKSSKTFTVEANQLENYGLNNPLATINIELQDNTNHQVVLGNPTFDEEQIYAQINPAEGETQTISILPIDFQYAVDRSLSEWKQSPPAEEQQTPDPDLPSQEEE